MYRTHTCGELRIANAGQTVTLAGWVQKARKLGGMTFIDLRDRYGVTQLVVEADAPAELVGTATALGREFVIQATGEVLERQAKNPKMPTGDIEIKVSAINVLNKSVTPPFTIEDESDGGEDLRMKFRYLDLRRGPLKKALMLRHRIAHEVRNYLDGLGFMEIETPYLIKSTPEGARDFVVPSRMNPGQFYALPQSPQTFKQLLMVAGYDRYFQIVRCFRDEDLRADRQPEFTQIDCEMSFVEQEDVLGTFEGMMRTLFKNVLGVDVPNPLPRMSWYDAMDKYGSDKPDVRFGMEIHELTDVAKGKGFGVLDGAAYIGAIAVPGAAEYTRKQIDELTEWVKRPQVGAKGLIYIRVNADGSFKSSIDKFYAPEDLAKIAAAAEAKPATCCWSSAAMPSARSRPCSASSASRWAAASASATRRCSPRCGSSISRSSSGTTRPSASTQCTTPSRPRSRSTRSGSIPIRKRTWSASAPMPTTSSSTATSSAAVPSGSTTPTCRSGCSRCSASVPRRPNTSSVSSSTPSSMAPRRTAASPSASTASAPSSAARIPSATTSPSRRTTRAAT